MKPKRQRGILSPVSLREVYASTGEYTAKMIIDPSLSQTIERVDVEVRNSDGKKMDFVAKRWGTKLTIDFVIDDSTPDGVSVIDVTLHNRVDKCMERFDFWVFK